MNTQITNDCYNVISLVAITVNGELTIDQFEDALNKMDIPENMKTHAIMVVSSAQNANVNRAKYCR